MVKSILILSISPWSLISLAFLQIVLAYLFYVEKAAAHYDGVIISYMPIVLWGFAVLAVYFGVFAARIITGPMCQKHSYQRFVSALEHLSTTRLKIIFWTLVIVIFINGALIVREVGGVPLILIVSGQESVSNLNALQKLAPPGLFGFNTFLLFSLEALLALFFMRKYFFGSNCGIPLWFGVVVVVFAATLTGKRQGLVIFFILVLVCLSVAYVLSRSRNVKLIKPVRSPFFYIFLSLATLSLIYFLITFYRLGSTVELKETFLEPLRYLSLPIINLEFLWSVSGFGGLDLNVLKPFETLVPAKLMNGRGDIPFVLPEETSPLGFFALAWLSWGGVVGIMLYGVCVGFFCFVVYRRILVSPSATVIYGFLVWTLFASHTYNHFLTITFLPAQLVSVYLITHIARVSKVSKHTHND